jgi:hypothetical protein
VTHLLERASPWRSRTARDGHVVFDHLCLACPWGLSAAGTDFSAHADPHTLLDGPLVTDDPLILDERFLSAPVRGRGVTVVSACSHAGIVNAALAAQAAFPGEPIDVLLRGYHLAGTALASAAPERYAPSVVGTSYDLLAVLTRRRQSGRARSA